MTAEENGPCLRYQKDGRIAWIIADNSARMNAYTAAMWRAIPEHVATAVADPEVRIIVLRGAGDKAFSAGADISEFETSRTGDAAKVYDAVNHATFPACTRLPARAGGAPRVRASCTVPPESPRSLRMPL